MDLREKLETAISKLQLIIDTDAEESIFQEWFSQNPIVFDVFGYKRKLEHPRLLYEGETFIPDFMAQTITDEWEIIELKTADAGILKDTNRRHAFFSEAEKNLSQCREYSLLFYDTACRQAFNKHYNTTCHKTPIITLVIGRNEGVDKLLVYELLAGRIPRIKILTYDDVINHLKARYESLVRGVVGRPNGIYLAFAVCPIETSEEGEMYIADICQHKGKSRIRLFISGEYFTMQINDATGQKASMVRSKVQGLYAHNAYEVEVQPMKYETEISVSIGGDKIMETTIRNTDFDFSGPLDTVMGSDQSGEAKSSMLMGAFIVIPSIPDIDQKAILREHIKTIVGNDGEQCLLEFIGHKYMHNQGHLTLGSRATHSATSLVQEIEAHKPILRRR
jgi:hypothetical protein